MRVLSFIKTLSLAGVVAISVGCASQPPEVDRKQQERDAYNRADMFRSVEEWKTFFREYPDNQYGELAQLNFGLLFLEEVRRAPSSASYDLIINDANVHPNIVEIARWERRLYMQSSGTEPANWAALTSAFPRTSNTRGQTVTFSESGRLNGMVNSAIGVRAVAFLNYLLDTKLNTDPPVNAEAQSKAEVFVLANGGSRPKKSPWSLKCEIDRMTDQTSCSVGATFDATIGNTVKRVEYMGVLERLPLLLKVHTSRNQSNALEHIGTLAVATTKFARGCTLRIDRLPARTSTRTDGSVCIFDQSVISQMRKGTTMLIRLDGSNDTNEAEIDLFGFGALMNDAEARVRQNR